MEMVWLYLVLVPVQHVLAVAWLKYALRLYYLDWKVTRGGAVSQENRFESKGWKKEPGQPKDSTLGGTSLGA